MPQCVVPGCHNRSDRKKRFGQNNVTFHRFPKDDELRDKWVNALSKEDFDATPHTVLCSIHFREEDVDRTSPFRVYIKKDAVPSLFMSNLSKNKRGRRRKMTTSNNKVKGKRGRKKKDDSKIPEKSTQNDSPTINAGPLTDDQRSTKPNVSPKRSVSKFFEEVKPALPSKTVNHNIKDATATDLPAIKVVRFGKTPGKSFLDTEVNFTELSVNILNQINSGNKPLLTPSKEELEQMLIESLIKLNEKTKRLETTEENIIKLSNKIKKLHQKNKCLIKRVVNLKLIVKNLREKNYLNEM